MTILLCASVIDEIDSIVYGYMSVRAIFFRFI